MKIAGCTVSYVSADKVWMISGSELFIVDVTFVKRVYSEPLKENSLVWAIYNEKNEVMMLFDYKSTSQEELEKSLAGYKEQPVALKKVR